MTHFTNVKSNIFHWRQWAGHWPGGRVLHTWRAASAVCSSRVRSVCKVGHMSWCLRLKIWKLYWGKVEILLKESGFSAWHEYEIPSYECFYPDLWCRGQLLRGGVFFVSCFFPPLFSGFLFYFGFFFCICALVWFFFLTEWLKQLLSSWEENG